MYIAHTLRNERGEIIKTQSLEEHLTDTAELAAGFASVFRGEEWARAAGLAHDVGKSSPAGQRRMLDPEHAPKVDHATRGAQALRDRMPRCPPILPFAVCGHHGRLPDGGDPADADLQAGTLCARLRKQVPDCANFLENWAIPMPSALSLSPYDGKLTHRFSLAFFTRMIHSCLVDADFLNTEAFMRGVAAERGQFAPVCVLRDRLDAHMARFEGKTGVLNRIRAEILRDCREAALLRPGLFTLTVPTGGGKTLASLAFALRHAAEYGMRRVIYAIPYTSILEQTVDVFAEAVGRDQVLAHYMDALCPDAGDGQAEDDESPDIRRRRLATENWDAGLIVTTNVQLFESLYASRVSRCRKLHNLAGSVLVLDEAQLIPTEYLLPCLRALEELALNYGTTVVLMSATQPELAPFFRSVLPVREISRRIPESYAALKRATITHQGVMSLNDVAGHLTESPQVLCIVNTRKSARALYRLLPQEGRFHLSTLMLPEDRRRVLALVRARLREGLPCRLVATSLVEAGVDLDFPCGWREETGLDSLLQAAGRVNREGVNAAADSVLNVFRLADSRPAGQISQRASVSRGIFRLHGDVTSPDAIAAYFQELYGVKGAEALDTINALKRLNVPSCLFPFDQIAREFHLIRDAALPVVILSGDEAGESLRKRLMSGDVDRALLRRVGARSVRVYAREADRLLMAGKVAVIGGGDARRGRGGADGTITLLLQDIEDYDPDLGLNIDPEEGSGLYIE